MSNKTTKQIKYDVITKMVDIIDHLFMKKNQKKNSNQLKTLNN